MTYDVKSQKMIKSSDEIAKMKVAGKLAAQTLEMIEQHVQPGYLQVSWIESVTITLSMKLTVFLLP